MLLRYHEHCRGTEPPELIALIGETVERMHQTYGGDMDEKNDGVD